MKWDKTQKVWAGVNSFSPEVSHVTDAICGFHGFPVHNQLEKWGCE